LSHPSSKPTDELAPRGFTILLRIWFHSRVEDMLLRHSLPSLSLNRVSADFDTTEGRIEQRVAQKPNPSQCDFRIASPNFDLLVIVMPRARGGALASTARAVQFRREQFGSDKFVSAPASVRPGVLPRCSSQYWRFLTRKQA
jgi:hypothetical protein